MILNENVLLEENAHLEERDTANGVLFNMMENGITLDGLKNLVYQLEAANCDELDLNNFMSTLGTIAECNLLDDSEEARVMYENLQMSALLEYAGKDEKNDEYKKLLSDMEANLKKCIDNTALIGKWLDTIVPTLKKIKNESSPIIKILEESKKSYNKMVTATSSAFGQREWNEMTKQYTKFKKASKTFNNKYSTVGLENKKAMEQKLRQYDTQVGKFVREWLQEGSAKMLELMKEYDRAKYIDKNNVGDYCRYINTGLRYYVFGVRACMSWLYSIRKCMNIKFEGSLRYKIVQKVLK